jgi:hypothetical protein
MIMTNIEKEDNEKAEEFHAQWLLEKLRRARNIAECGKVLWDAHDSFLSKVYEVAFEKAVCFIEDDEDWLTLLDILPEPEDPSSIFCSIPSSFNDVLANCRATAIYCL